LKNKPYKIPTREEVAAFIKASPTTPSKRQIADAFHLHGLEARLALKNILLSLKKEEGVVIKKGPIKKIQGVFKVQELEEGRLYAHLVKPTHRHPSKKTPFEVFEIIPSTLMPSLDSFDVGDTFFGESLKPCTVSPIRMIKDVAAEENLIGLIVETEGRFWFQSCDRHHKGLMAVVGADTVLRPLVHTYVTARFAPGKTDVIEIVKPLGSVEAVSEVVILRHQLPHVFSPEALALTEDMVVPSLEGRTDIRSLDIVTIDGVSAQDFDDAVWAEPDPKNPGGWHLVVAIADVSHYVQEGDALDQEAYKRGNSVYFPDRVVPMLPERISNGLCSLRPMEDRACLAVHLWIDAEGELKNHSFFRGLMCSKARLTYEQVENILKGQKSDLPPEILTALQNVTGAYHALLRARNRREPLAIHVPEVEVHFQEGSHAVESVANAPVLESNQLIEEFMVLANRAAAQTLEKHHLGGVFRVHDKPSLEKVDEFQNFLKGHAIRFKGTFQKAHDFNVLTRNLKDSVQLGALYDMILKSQSKALYGPNNSGHFGLQLEDYCHFTSPIRRYADLMVHRALSYWLVHKEKSPRPKNAPSVTESCAHISERERAAVVAERESVDRFVSLYFEKRVGEEFTGYISGIGGAGLFVTLNEVHVTGLLPMEALSDDYYLEKQGPWRLEGRRFKRKFTLGDVVQVQLATVDLAKGRLRFSIPSLKERPARAFRKHSSKKR